MTARDKAFGRVMLLVGCVGVLLAAAPSPSRATAGPGAKKDAEFAEIAASVLTEMRQNRAKLRCGYLVHVKHGRQFNEKGEATNQSKGEFQLWKKGVKLAIQWQEDANTRDPNGKPITERAGARQVWDGSESRFSNNPDLGKVKDVCIRNGFKPFSDSYWLDVTGWHSFKPECFVGNVEKMLAGKLSDVITVGEWKIKKGKDGGRRLVTKIVDNANRPGINGFYIRYEVDLDKGCNPVLEEVYSPTGQLENRTRVEVQQVAKGFWFPVAVEKEGYVNGKPYALVRYALDLGKSTFNQCDSIPDSVFEMPITPDIEVSDERGPRKIIYSGRNAPVPMNELREEVNRFVAGSDLDPRQPRGRLLLLRISLCALGLSLPVLGLRRFVRQRARSEADSSASGPSPGPGSPTPNTDPMAD